MDSFKQTFTRIKGSFSESRRLPRLGKIRLGLKVETLSRQPGKGPVQYPKETEHFVVPPEVAAVYGESPTELDVMLPANDPELVFVQKLARYGSTAGLKCHGNGEKALRLNEQTREWEDRTCPCEYLKTDENPRGDCTEQSSLMVILPRVSMGGCYQIDTRSYHSTVTINSALEFIQGLCGRIALIPLKLRRELRETHHAGQKQIHYTLNLVLDADINTVRALRDDHQGTLIPSRVQIEGPVDENPLTTPVDVQEIDAEELAQMSERQLDEARDRLKAKREGNGAQPQPSGGTSSVAIEEGPQADELSPNQDLIISYQDKMRSEATVKGLADIANEFEADTHLTSDDKMSLRSFFATERNKRAAPKGKR